MEGKLFGYSDAKIMLWLFEEIGGYTQPQIDLWWPLLQNAYTILKEEPVDQYKFDNFKWFDFRNNPDDIRRNTKFPINLEVVEDYPTTLKGWAGLQADSNILSQKNPRQSR